MKVSQLNEGPTSAEQAVNENPIIIDRRGWMSNAVSLVGTALLGSKVIAAATADSPLLETAGMPYDAFDLMPADQILVKGGRIRVAFGPGKLAVSRERILDYVRQSARSVEAYFGTFPAGDTRLLILTTESPGRPVRSGTAFGYRGAAIKLTMATNVSAEDLTQDWILVHEMSHLALPSLPREQHWLEEGMASYVEPLARAQAGVLGVGDVWAGMIKGLPQGLPQAGDRGLDHTPTWGRTYWGGALFCLLADVEIRERTRNRNGLQNALRAILGRANMETDSTVEPLLRVGDQAVGVPVLASLYARMKDKPYPVDLNEMWQRLGVQLAGTDVRFNDVAPLAAIRRSLTLPIADV